MTSEPLNSLLKQNPAPTEPVRHGPRSQTPDGFQRQRRIKKKHYATLPMPDLPSAYTLSGKVIAEASAALLWTSSWAFNGVCTMLAWLSIVEWVALRLGQPGAIWTSNWFQVPGGVILHIAISSMEQHLWRSLDAVPPGLTLAQRAARLLQSVRTWESVAVGAFDAWTTSRVLVIILGWLGLVGVGGIVGAAILGTALALAAEPMMRYHGVGLRVLMKGVRDAR